MNKGNIKHLPYNLCTRFLLPLLKLDNIWLCSSNKNKGRRLCNSFITSEIDDSEFKKTDHLYVLIQSYDYDESYTKKIDQITLHPLCDGIWELDLEYTLISFNMSSIEDYYRFIEGRYSDYSEKGKRLCIDSPFSSAAMNKQILPIVQHIFNKQEERKQYISSLFGMSVSELKDCELAPIYDSTSEEIGTNILNDFIIDFFQIKITTNH